MKLTKKDFFDGQEMTERERFEIKVIFFAMGFVFGFITPIILYLLIAKQ